MDSSSSSTAAAAAAGASGPLVELFCAAMQQQQQQQQGGASAALGVSSVQPRAKDSAGCCVLHTPHVYACSNPGCGSMASTGELELVTAKNSVCSGCRAARLCSKECMKGHWHRHKPACKHIGAANKAAAK
uniref:MYND-type domain-containing protein n=1 Tax=Tetradesmus obliquus TaxID=3088 RepID=A0A383V7P4_TETOB|eukprot:jgi/Sobl393_1/5811/SZX61605.1